MKKERMLAGLTLVNLVLLAVLLGRAAPGVAHGRPGVLRGSALEIVDDRGRVRASIVVQPEDPAHPLPDGRPHPENVILRLSDANGRPSVKLAESEVDAGLALVGATDETYVILKAEGAEASLKLKEGPRQQVLRP